MGQTLSEPITAKQSSSLQNKLVKVGSSSMQGWRISMEDAHTHILTLAEDKDAAFFAGDTSLLIHMGCFHMYSPFYTIRGISRIGATDTFAATSFKQWVFRNPPEPSPTFKKSFPYYIVELVLQ